MFDWLTVSSVFFDIHLPLLGQNIFFCFSGHQGSIFFFFLLLSLTLTVLQWHHEESNFFSEYGRSIWLFYVWYYFEVSSSLLYVQELVHYFLSLIILSPTFSSSTTFQSSPINSPLTFLVSRILSHMKRCSYITPNGFHLEFNV